jgi:hypothetical protein
MKLTKISQSCWSLSRQLAFTRGLCLNMPPGDFFETLRLYRRILLYPTSTENCAVHQMMFLSGIYFSSSTRFYFRTTDSDSLIVVLQSVEPFDTLHQDGLSQRFELIIIGAEAQRLTEISMLESSMFRDLFVRTVRSIFSTLACQG